MEKTIKDGEKCLYRIGISMEDSEGGVENNTYTVEGVAGKFGQKMARQMLVKELKENGRDVLGVLGIEVLPLPTPECLLGRTSEELVELSAKYVDMLESQCHSGDTEADHGAADALVCALLKELGFARVVEAWGDVDKWYA